MVNIRLIYSIVFIIILIALIVSVFVGFHNKLSVPSAPCEFNPTVCKIGDALGIPGFFLSSRHFIWYFILPIVVVGIVIYGFLEILRIFGRTVNIILSVATALILIPTQIYTMLVATVMTILGTYSVFAFAIVFVFGVTLVSIGTMTRIHGQFAPSESAINAKMRTVRESIRRLENNTQLRNSNPVAWQREMREYERELADLLSQRDTIKTFKKTDRAGGHP